MCLNFLLWINSEDGEWILNKNSKGKAQKGSKLLIQKYVNEKQEQLNEQILKASPSLLTFINEDLLIEWKSPLKEEGYREYMTGFLNLVDVWKGKQSQLRNYWPQRGASWDGVAIVNGKQSENGLLLVEAKAHLDEMRSGSKAKNHDNNVLINKTINEVRTAVGSNASMEFWMNEYYQLANRLSFLYLFNKKLNIPTWLVLVNFVEDKSYKSTTVSKWLHHYNEVFSKMGIDEENELFSKVISVYPVGI
jgi:hypothetical protein